VDDEGDQQRRQCPHDKCSELHVSLRVTRSSQNQAESAENPENLRAK
jgi:hypothetical protein